MRLRLQPLVELVLRHHFEVGPHVVVPQPAELRAHDLVLPDLRRGEMKRDDQARNEVLLDAELADEERVSDILGVQREQDRLVHRDRRASADDDVVARRGVVGRIEAEVIAVAIVDLVRMKRAEFPVRPGIAEIEGELLRLHVDRAAHSDPAA